MIATQQHSVSVQAGGSQLLGPENLVALGAFRLATTTGFEYAGRRPLAFNQNLGRLLVGGYDIDMKFAEVSTPTSLGTGTYNTLPTVTTQQPLVSLASRISNLGQSGANPDRLGGMLALDDGRIVASYYRYYDASLSMQLSHVLLDSGDLATANVTPLRKVGSGIMSGSTDVTAGFTGGYMSRVPAEHQATLGGSYVTGQGCLSIIGRTSYGPSLFSFDPGGLSSGNVSVTPLLYYTQAHQLRQFDSTNDYFNGTTKLDGVCVVKGSNSVLFFGRHGTGTLFYGTAQNTDPTAPNYDPTSTASGFHAYPYRYQVWAYDIDDLEAVRLGSKQPWEPQPVVWELTLTHSYLAKTLGGAGYDEANNRIYLNVEDASNGKPVFEVVEVQP